MRTAIPPELTEPCRLLFARRGIPTGRGIPPPGLVPVVSRPALRLRRHGAGSRLLLWSLGTANQLAYDPSRSRASSWVGWFRFENHFRLFFSKYFFFVSKACGIRLPALHCRWNVIATQPIGLVPFQARGILQRPEEQSRTGSCQGSSVAGQPQCPRLWHSSTPNARFLSHSPSAPPPPFTQSPYPPRSLVRDEQTHPHRPRLVVSHSTCPPLSSSPHANSFVIGPAVINHTHTPGRSSQKSPP